MIFLVAIKDLEKSSEEIYYQSKILKKWFIKDNSHSIKKRVNEGDKILIYKSGRDGGYFLGEVLVNGNLERNNTEIDFFRNFEYCVSIKEVRDFKNKIYLKEHKDNLKFVKNKKNLGSSLQRGYAVLQEEDYSYLIEKILEKGE